MPTTDQKSDSKPVNALPGHELSCSSAVGPAGLSAAAEVILSVSPSQPPTRCSPIRVRGVNDATITKNWSTSL